MKLKRIMIQNIRSYDIAEIEFPDGNLLLSGDIGSGKSSILLAVEFALFGVPRGIGGGSLLRNGENVGGVKLEFEVDGKNVKIERKLKKVKDSIRQERGYIEVDGVKETLSTTELKSRVLDLLKYPQEFMGKNPVLYKYTVYTPQEEMKSILTEDSSLRMNTLRRVFGIDRYKRIIENSGIVSSRIKDQIKMKEGMVADLENRKTELNSKKEERERVRQDVFAFKERLEAIMKKADLKRKDVEEVEVKLKDVAKLKADQASFLAELKMKKEQRENNGVEIKRLQEKISVAEEKISKSNIDLKEVEEILKKVNEKERELNEVDKKCLELTKLIAGDEANKASLQRVVSSVTAIDNCPMCKQKVGEEHKCQIKDETEEKVSRLDENLVKNRKEKRELEVKKREIIQEINSLREKDRKSVSIKLEMKNLEDNKQSLQRLEATAQMISQKLVEITKKNEEIEERMSSFRDLDQKYALLKRELEEIKDSEKSVEINKARTERRLEDLEGSIIKYEEEIEKKQKIKARIGELRRTRDWITKDFVKIIGEIEKAVMNKVHSEFSGLFGKWFSVLTDGLNARINEDFTPVIEQQGYEIDYAFLSGGERTAAALAYRLALNQVVNSLMSNIKTKDILILDEPTEGFSSEQLDKMRNVLQELKVSQLILVSHEAKIESFVDKIIRFHKDDVTRVVN